MNKVAVAINPSKDINQKILQVADDKNIKITNKNKPRKRGLFSILSVVRHPAHPAIF